MTQSETYAELAERSGIDKKGCKAVVDALVALTYAEAKNKFKIPNLCMVYIRDKKAGTARNPRTGETIKTKAKKVAKIRLIKAAKEAIVPSAPKAKTAVKAVKGKTKAK